MLSTLCSIPEAIEEIKAGRILIVIDDENRENEGDFMVAAERVTPEIINFMARHGRGLICLPTTKQRLEELDICMMVDGKTSLEDTPFTVSVDAANAYPQGFRLLIEQRRHDYSVIPTPHLRISKSLAICSR